MMILAITLLTMFAATLAQHLGLLSAMAKIASKIASCSMCSTFWACLGVLTIKGESVEVSAILAIAAAYASNWVLLLLLWLQSIYNRVWDRLK